jgi:hypothetical protein
VLNESSFQEIVLADRAAFVYGTRHIDATSFMDFLLIGAYGSGGYITYDRRVADCLPSRPKISNLSYEAIRNITNSRIDLQSEKDLSLAELLYGLRNHRVKEPVDRIWSIIGLLSEELQAKLASAVDYSEEVRVEYHKTYVKFFRAAIVILQSVSLLMLPPTIGDDDLLPSWCSDLSAEPMCALRISGYWNRPVAVSAVGDMGMLHEDDDKEKSEARARAITSHPLRNITFIDHDDTLHVRGFVVDRIAEIVRDSDVRGQDSHRQEFGGWEQWTMENPAQAAAVKWLEEGLSLARRLSHTSNEEIPPYFLMSVLADWRITPEAERAIRNALKSMTTGGYDYFRTLEEGERGYVWSTMSYMKYLVGHCFFATAGGRFGIAVPGCKVGDEVCALYGGEVLYNMRRTGSERSTVKFCGVAFIPPLMEQHQRDAARLQEDEIFCIQ